MHLHTTKVYNTRPVYSLNIGVFTEVLTLSKVINAFNWWTEPFWKSLTTFTLIIPKMSSQNKACRCGTLQFLSPVSTVSAKKAWDHDSFLACTHERKEQKKKRLHFWSFAAKQEKLVSIAACLNQNLFAYDRMSTRTCLRPGNWKMAY